MNTAVTREKVHFESGGVRCAAWLYPGTNGACVIMAGGLAVTKEPGTDRFAARFSEAGYAVLAFDYRHLGESGGQPRQLARVGEQHADWHAAIAHAASLRGVDPSRLAIWGFSASAGHVFPVAARNPTLAAAIASAPLADGPRAMPNAMRHQRRRTLMRFSARAARDAIGLRLGRDPLLVPLAGERGTVTSLTSPDAQNGARALDPDGRYSDWQQQIAASSAMRIGLYRPARHAARVRCPLLVLVSDADGVAPPTPAIAAARRAPRGELARLPGGHYAAFMDAHELAVQLQLAFLDAHLRDHAGDRATAPALGV